MHVNPSDKLGQNQALGGGGVMKNLTHTQLCVCCFLLAERKWKVHTLILDELKQTISAQERIRLVLAP